MASWRMRTVVEDEREGKRLLWYLRWRMRIMVEEERVVPPAVGQGQQGQQVARGAHHDYDHDVGDNESGEVLGGLWEAEVLREVRRDGC